MVRASCFMLSRWVVYHSQVISSFVIQLMQSATGRRGVWPCLVPALAGCLLAGCVPIPDGFDSPVPGRRIDASVRAAYEQDAQAIPQLISLLDSEDPAARLIAHNALERIVGHPIEFDHAASWPERRTAVERLRDQYKAGQLEPAKADTHEAVSTHDLTGGTDG